MAMITVMRERWLSVVLSLSKGSPECSSLAPPVICLANQAGVMGVYLHPTQVQMSKPQSAGEANLKNPHIIYGGYLCKSHCKGSNKAVVDTVKAPRDGRFFSPNSYPHIWQPHFPNNP